MKKINRSLVLIRSAGFLQSQFSSAFSRFNSGVGVHNLVQSRFFTSEGGGNKAINIVSTPIKTKTSTKKV